MMSDEHGGHKNRKTLFVVTMHSNMAQHVLCANAVKQKTNCYAVLRTMHNTTPLTNRGDHPIFELIWMARLHPPATTTANDQGTLRCSPVVLRGGGGL